MVTMISWEARKRLRNIREHGIDFADLDGLFENDLLTLEDERVAYGEPRYQSLGVFNGVTLFVVWSPRGADGDTTHLISARKAEKHEAEAWYARYTKRH